MLFLPFCEQKLSNTYNVHPPSSKVPPDARVWWLGRVARAARTRARHTRLGCHRGLLNQYACGMGASPPLIVMPRRCCAGATVTPHAWRDALRAEARYQWRALYWCRHCHLFLELPRVGAKGTACCDSAASEMRICRRTPRRTGRIDTAGRRERGDAPRGALPLRVLFFLVKNNSNDNCFFLTLFFPPPLLNATGCVSLPVSRTVLPRFAHASPLFS